MSPSPVPALRLSAIALIFVPGLIVTTPVAFAARQDGCAVVVAGGTSASETNLDIVVNGGTAIADATGGDTNVATTGGDVGDVASAGNGGVANAAANGGAVTVGNVNSGDNLGNTITVGDSCLQPPPMKPDVKKPAAAPAAKAARLPRTGVGLSASGGQTGGALPFAAATLLATGAAGMALRRRFW
jgi:hypothetical protein